MISFSSSVSWFCNVQYTARYIILFLVFVFCTGLLRICMCKHMANYYFMDKHNINQLIRLVKIQSSISERLSNSFKKTDLKCIIVSNLVCCMCMAAASHSHSGWSQQPASCHDCIEHCSLWTLLHMVSCHQFGLQALSQSLILQHKYQCYCGMSDC